MTSRGRRPAGRTWVRTKWPRRVPGGTARRGGNDPVNIGQALSPRVRCSRREAPSFHPVSAKNTEEPQVATRMELRLPLPTFRARARMRILEAIG